MPSAKSAKGTSGKFVWEWKLSTLTLEMGCLVCHRTVSHPDIATATEAKAEAKTLMTSHKCRPIQTVQR